MRCALVALTVLCVTGCKTGPSGLHLDQVAPATVCPGARIDLFGGGFGGGGAGSFITVGGVNVLPAPEAGASPSDAQGKGDAGGAHGQNPGSILDWQDNHIAAIVPSGPSGNALVTVTIASGAVSNAYPVDLLCGREAGPPDARPHDSAALDSASPDAPPRDVAGREAGPLDARPHDGAALDSAPPADLTRRDGPGASDGVPPDATPRDTSALDTGHRF